MRWHFVRATAEQRRELCARRWEELPLVALRIDGVAFAGQGLVVALGVTEDGAKHVLGLWPGATENAAVVKALLEDLVQRGLDRTRRVCRWRDGKMVLRWAAAALLMTEQRFRQIMGYRDLWMLKAALDRSQTAIKEQVA